MNQSGLESFGAYRKALELFDLVVADMAELRKDSRCYRLVAQRVASADSICASIEEGYGRLSRPEYVRFLDFARGSARETLGRYNRMRHWLPQELVEARVALAGEIVGILTASIQTLRRNLETVPGTSYLKEEGMPGFPADETFPPSTLDT